MIVFLLLGGCQCLLVVTRGGLWYVMLSNHDFILSNEIYVSYIRKR